MAFTKALTSATQPPVWEQTYAVTETKKCVEGAAGTRGADETITEGLFVTPPVNCNDIKKIEIVSKGYSFLLRLLVLYSNHVCINAERKRNYHEKFIDTDPFKCSPRLS